MPFGQLVIGPPGSGKSTYCDGMQQFMGAIGRNCSIVNLDPANDRTSYEAALDIRDLVTLDEIMKDEELGPNGAILYALEELEHNMSWLDEGLKGLGEDQYVIFDCPGQVELFTHHASLKNIFVHLQKIGYRLVVLHLLDSHVLTQPSLYISALLVALRGMLQMELPHLNVFTKIDNLASYPPLPFGLEFYTEVHDLTYLLPYMEDEQRLFPRQPTSLPSDTGHPDTTKPQSKLARLGLALAELVTDFGLLSFHTLAVEDKQSMMTLLRAIDTAGGYIFTGRPGDAEASNEAAVWQTAMREGATMMDARDVQERWVTRRAEFDEIERKGWREEAGLPAEEEEGGEVRNAADLRGRGGSQERKEEGDMWNPSDSGIKVVKKHG
ncbi:hypothetical protein P152DRAFT_465087 [Eremomyces bilateralis CBS 781.70]|uniref:GPN-loop GTPase 2 n=1 Tax=Eremomyces bilateralis CBS 781.70 TaxID=1392243 RepID=A0A6G1G879_9PEZI|nr:uncharacterized protein P152DRAFT_465087 [Eremomyces bilateralis CBS 781.70]KAF1814131.1 hypothetical protein P152DRAFT_465087 [Eremomyces bilateralis CBS 781.70]